MSVQAGIWKHDGKPVESEEMVFISRNTVEYGPDGETLDIDGNIGLLYRPFHTTAESRLETQPYEFVPGKKIIWDGRLDNRSELLVELGHQFKGENTDVAIVASAFERWGASSFEKLVGDWALTIWDASAKELILARDYIGIRGLFYRRKANAVLWCSQLAPIVLHSAPCHLNDEYIAGYLSFMPHAHHTAYGEINAVPPGHFVRITESCVSTHSYWTFDPSRKTRYKSDRDYEEAFFGVFAEAVRCRLRTDSPLLSDLSGGHDSTANVCMADYLFASQKAAPIPAFDTFSFFDPDEPDEEDILYFTEVQKFRHKTGYEAKLVGAGDTFLLELQTFAPAPVFGMRQELIAAKSDIIAKGRYRVLMSGNGGDQMSGQGLDARAALGDLLLQLRLPTLAKQLVSWSLLTRTPAIQLLSGTLTSLLPRRIQTFVIGASRKINWINSSFAKEHRIGERVLATAAGSCLWLPTAREKFHTLLRLRGEMTHAQVFTQEMRYPFLDRRLVEFLFSIPTDQLVHNGQRRSLMRRALAHIVPRSVLTRQTKSGTGRCAITTLNKHRAAIMALLRSPLSVEFGYLNGAALREAIGELHKGHVPLYIGQLLRAIHLEVWLRDVIKRGIIRSSSADKAATTAAISDGEQIAQATP